MQKKTGRLQRTVVCAGVCRRLARHRLRAPLAGVRSQPAAARCPTLRRDGAPEVLYIWEHGATAGRGKGPEGCSAAVLNGAELQFAAVEGA